MAFFNFHRPAKGNKDDYKAVGGGLSAVLHPLGWEVTITDEKTGEVIVHEFMKCRFPVVRLTALNIARKILASRGIYDLEAVKPTEALKSLPPPPLVGGKVALPPPVETPAKLGSMKDKLKELKAKKAKPKGG
jgi:hypothetical protein